MNPDDNVCSLMSFYEWAKEITQRFVDPESERFQGNPFNVEYFFPEDLKSFSSGYMTHPIVSTTHNGKLISMAAFSAKGDSVEGILNYLRTVSLMEYVYPYQIFCQTGIDAETKLEIKKYIVRFGKLQKDS